MSRPSLRVVLSLVLCLSASACAPEEADELDLRIRWSLTDPSAALPAGLTRISLRVYRATADLADGCVAPDCEESNFTVAGLPTRDGGRRYLPRENLPTGESLRLVLVGSDEGGERWIGQVGPLILGVGERRFVDIQMYEIGESVTAATIPGRLLPTTSTLPDGRVLIAGGFDRVSDTACPEGLPDETVCFRLVATDEAYAFDISTGNAEPIRARMLDARGGHRATTLPDGRILLTGGAPAATLALVPQVGAGISGFAPAFFPEDDEGEPGAHASFELFDAFRGDAPPDLDRTGDLGGGSFLGLAGAPNEAGPLNAPRFLHAATRIADTPDRVLLAGGVSAPTSYEIFDGRRTGGHGVLADLGVLRARRSLPAAASVGRRVWIIGGVERPSGDEELAEIWQSTDASPIGVSLPANEVESAFPTAPPRPDMALLSPLVALVGDRGSHIVASGWLGPRCDATVMSPTPTPIYASDTESETVLCPAPSPRSHSFTVASNTGVVGNTGAIVPHSFGAVAPLDTGEVLITGGLANLALGAQAAIDVLEGTLDMGGAARINPRRTLRISRAMHGSAGVINRAVVTAGGATFTAGRISLVEPIEVQFLPR